MEDAYNDIFVGDCTSIRALLHYTTLQYTLSFLPPSLPLSLSQEKIEQEAEKALIWCQG